MLIKSNEKITVLDAIMILRKAECDYNKLDAEKITKLLRDDSRAQQKAQHFIKI